MNDLYLLHCRRVFDLPLSPFSTAIDLHLLIDFSATLALMLKARVPLTNALEIMAASGGSRSSEVCRRLLSSIESGLSLSESTLREEHVFGRVFPALLALGETTGEMEEVLDEMEASVRGQLELRERTRQLLIYPVFVGVVLIGVIAFLMVFVVPELISFIQSVGQNLPQHTRFLIAVSNALQAYWFSICVFFSALAGTAGILYRTYSIFRGWCDTVVLLIPVVGPLNLRLKLAQFSHHMAVLGRSDVDLLEAMSVSQTLLDNCRLEQAVTDARLQVLEGSSLAEALQRDGIFPLLFCSLIQIGEAGGELTPMFVHVSKLYQREAQASMNAAEQLVAPVLMSIVGGLLLWVIVSVLSPVYDAVLSVGIQYP